MKQLRQAVLALTLMHLGLMAAPASAEAKSALDLFRALTVKNGQWQAAARFSDEGVHGIRVAERVALHVSTQAKSLSCQILFGQMK